VATTPDLDNLARRPWREVEAPEKVRAVPTMLSAQEQALLYVLARDHAGGEGAIVDAGCFLGGSSAALLAGVRDRTEPWTGPPVASYDRFRVEEYTLEQFFSDVPGIRVGDSFRSRYDAYVAGYGVQHEVHEGDIVEIGWAGGPIDILFLDVLKTWEINDAVLRDFFPHVVPGRTIIVHQDYGWGLAPWLHMTVELMRDSLSWLDSVWCSHVFLVDRPIPEHLFTAELRRDLDDQDKLALIDRAIARNDGGSAEMVTLSKAAMLGELGRVEDAHELVDSVEAGTEDPSVQLCIEGTRVQLGPRARRGLLGRLRRTR
jgi:hypothetical protein